MRNRSLSHLIFALYLISLSNVLAVRILTESDTKSSHFCHKTTSTGTGHRRLTFLGNALDGSYALLLYLTIWSSENKQLVKCVIDNDPVVTGTYLSLCDGAPIESDAETSLFNISMLLTPHGPCTLRPSDGLNFTESDRSASERHRHLEIKSRRKRAWVFPGTLWCGTGSNAIDYDQLGMFELADRCCREHDHCVNIIPAFSVNYGVFNPNLFTVSHCDCDRRFRQCLLHVNDTISNMVGYSFFNVLRVPCFRLTERQQCIELYWWGMCKVSKVAPYAVFKKPLAFNNTHVPDEDGDPHKSAGTGEHRSTARPSTTSKKKLIKGKPKPSAPTARCIPRHSPRGDPSGFKLKKRKGCKMGRKTARTQTNTPQTHAATSTALTSVPSMQTDASLMQTSQSKKRTHTTLRIASKRNTTTELDKGTKESKRKNRPRTVSRADPSRTQLHATTQPKKKTSTAVRKDLTTLEATAQTQATTTLMAATITPEGRKLTKAPKKRLRCGHKVRPRGDTFQPPWEGKRRKACLLEKSPEILTTSSTNAVLSIQKTRAQTQGIIHSNNTITPPTEMALSAFFENFTFTKPLTKPLLQTASSTEGSDRLQQRNLSSRWVKTDITAEESIVPAGNVLVCGTLKHLDECKYKIPPHKKKYDLQNREPKTVYHCDCTQRLADEMRHFKMHSTFKSLLVEFVSLSCFKSPSVKNCHKRNSCGFSKATALRQALTNIGEKGRIKAQSTTSKDSKRGTPFHLYKQCLRIVARTRKSYLSA